MNIITAANKSPKEKGVMQTLYFTSEQNKELLHIAGPTGVLLMTHYVAIAHQTNPIMEDAHLAKMLNMSESTIKKTRLALSKAGWFKKLKTTSKGKIHIIYLVGKAAVEQDTFASLHANK